MIYSLNLCLCAFVAKQSLLESVPARFFGNELRFGSRVFPAVERTNGVNAAEGLVIRAILEEGTDVRQLAACAAVDALPFALFRDGQYRC